MLTRVLGVFGAFLLLVLVYGSCIEPRFLLDDQKYEVEIPGLPTSWDGKQVALLADFQYGMWLDNESMMREAVEDALDEGASLVLVAGDFLYKPDSAKAEQVVDIVRPVLEAGVPLVAVLGNHDYSLMKKDSEERPPIAEYLTAQLREAGATVLENDAFAVDAPSGGDPLWIAGIGSVWAEDSHPDRALAAVPSDAARIVLMHNPESFRQIPAGQAPLALGAHTHGGQIRILPGDRNSWLDVVRKGETVADGWAADTIGAGSNQLYVNRGIGFSTVPIRINCRPELTVMTLRAIPAGAEARTPSRVTDS